MSQTIAPLSDSLSEVIKKQREWVYASFSIGKNNGMAPSNAADKIRLLQAIVDSNTIQKDETYKLQCLGIVLGDAITQIAPSIGSKYTMNTVTTPL